MDVASILLIGALVQDSGMPPLPEISVTEILDRAPSAVSATYTWQCGENAATLLVQIPQAKTTSGVKVHGAPNAAAFLNGISVGDERNRELVEAVRRIGLFPQIFPACSGGDQPRVAIIGEDDRESWYFIPSLHPD